MSIGHEVHLVTRIKDKEIVKLVKENNCSKVHQCDSEDMINSTALVQKIDKEINGLYAVVFYIDIEVKLLTLLNNLQLKSIHLTKLL